MATDKHFNFHVNIVSGRKGLERIRWVNASPGLLFIVLIILLASLKLQNSLYLIVSVTGLLASLVLIFRPFYANALVTLNKEGIHLKKGSSFEKKISWAEIREISFEDHSPYPLQGNSIGTVIRFREGELKFGIYRHLSKSPQQITQEFIRCLLTFPDVKDKLPPTLVEKFNQA